MVSKASDDLPEPDNPVNTISLSRGISRSTFLRLCSRAPRTWMVLWGSPEGGTARLCLLMPGGLAQSSWTGNVPKTGVHTLLPNLAIVQPNWDREHILCYTAGRRHQL